MERTKGFSIYDSANSMLDHAALHLEEEDDFAFQSRRFPGLFKPSVSTDASVVKQHLNFPPEEIFLNKMLGSEYLGNIFEIMNSHTESSDIHKSVYDVQPNGMGMLMNTSANSTDSLETYELFYRHSMPMTAVYCIAYLLVFAVGLVGNCFVIAVVFRTPRMRTVTNFFIVNLAIADILVVIFCLPATLMSNIFVRK